MVSSGVVVSRISSAVVRSGSIVSWSVSAIARSGPSCLCHMLGLPAFRLPWNLADRRDLEIPQVTILPHGIVRSHDGEDSSESEVIHGKEFLLDPLLRTSIHELLQETLDQGLSEIAVHCESPLIAVRYSSIVSSPCLL